MQLTPYPLLNNLIETPPPRYLFHYTDAAGLLGICGESKTLRATESNYLNDTKELVHARECFERILERLCFSMSVRGIGLRIKDDEKMRKTGTSSTLFSVLSPHIQKSAPGIFLCSFSEERDQLSQWRAYAGGQDGYAIGFPGASLRRVAEKTNYSLVKCVYDIETQTRIAREILTAHLEKFLSTDQSMKAAKEIGPEIQSDVSRFAPLFKHPSFAEEKEWRIFSPPIELNNSQVHYRASNSRLTPYIELHYEGDAATNEAPGQDPISVVAGPSPHQESNFAAMRGFLEFSFGKQVRIGKSYAPFRTGR